MFVTSSNPSVGAGWLMLLVSGCLFISPVRSQFGFFGPLLPPSTVYNISTSTVSLTVGTICYIPATANITQCRRRRGIQEKPYMIDGITGKIVPSQVLSVETTAPPLMPSRSFPGTIINRRVRPNYQNAPRFYPVPNLGLVLRSSKTIQDESEKEEYQVRGRNVMDHFLNRLVADQRKINMLNWIVVSSSCAGEPLNFSELLTCIGLTVQQTTTLTATLTVTQTTVFGFTEITLGGCTPANFPYPSCNTNSTTLSTR